MTQKNHALDSRIIDAAKQEFLEYGYHKASLHNISERAGITTGALYTRYSGKDDLFCSLVKDLLDFVNDRFEPMYNLYKEARESKNVDMLLEAIKAEQNIYTGVLNKSYDECKLFFCKSDGSTAGRNLKHMLKKKTSETVAFMNNLSNDEVDVDGIELIMYEQFDYYRQILEKGYSKKKALSCMDIVNTFVYAGWKQVFKKLIG